MPSSVTNGSETTENESVQQGRCIAGEKVFAEVQAGCLAKEESLGPIASSYIPYEESPESPVAVFTTTTAVTIITSRTEAVSLHFSVSLISPVASNEVL